ncbi:MucR family transcriptional regulator [Aureimonas sp. SK2]|uniref:MucR family transcriptional regulator n=1 Tax=Aureimonas sp. SK2 TaxID=3015992 RepID=UPI0024450E59|nr:MucR family transcriptional regulator [Aureimonas sp. SK2]
MADNLDNIDARLEQTAEIVAAYFSNNHVRQEEVPQVIAAVYAAVSGLAQPAAIAAPEPEPLQPAVPIKKSVTPDYIVCLEDGKQFKSLKRHLATHYDMTPDQYRAKWGLPKDYPMVAASYAARRSELAKTIGLGRKAKAQPEE